ncbi:hypothetical protein ABT356_33935 [Streptosporangium roseum]
MAARRISNWPTGPGSPTTCTGGGALLLDPTGELRVPASGYGDRLSVVAEAVPGRAELAGLLVRADGVVAWAADAGQVDPGSLEAALSAWLGAPAVAGAGAGAARASA